MYQRSVLNNKKLLNNKLKLNADKTEVMPVGSSSRLSLIDCERADVDGNSIAFKTSVKYLGVHLDQTLSMQQQISSLCRSAFLELCRIASIRPFLTQNGTAKLVVSMVISRLDYCNFILASLSTNCAFAEGTEQ